MVETTPIEKIRVTRLAEHAGASPQAFYYHFKDKYDLVAWIYLQDYLEITRNDSHSFSPEQIMLLMSQFQKRKVFYQRAFTDKSQNAIEKYATSHNLALMREAVELHQGKKMSTEQELAMLYHQHATTALLIDWIFDRIDIDLAQLARFQYEMTPEFLKEALGEHNYDNAHANR